MTRWCNDVPSLDNIPVSSSSACSISSSLTTTLRRGMRKIIVEAQASESANIAGVERRRRREMAAEISAELRQQRTEPHLQESHRAGGGAGGFRPDADGAGGGIRHHEGVGEHHDHLGAEQPDGTWLNPGEAPDEIQRLPKSCSASPNQISFSSDGAARSARKRDCRSDRQSRWSQTTRHIRRWCGPYASPRCRDRRRRR